MIQINIRNFISALGTLAVLAALLQGCGKDDLAGTSTETVTGKTTGLIFLADGKPAAGARIRVLPVGYEPLSDSGASRVFRTSTDDKGRYYLDSIGTGEYNILGDLEGESAYQDSVFLSGTARTLASDTLEEPGVVCGYVALQPGDLTVGATVQVLGTQAFANVDDSGFFRLPALAPGLYRASANADLPNYTAQHVSIRVRSGRTDTLSDTLRPRFTGIPQVTGLSAEFDTLNQQVHLRWTPTRFANFREYLVFRDRKGAVMKSTVAIAAIRDTVFVDNLWENPDPFGNVNFGTEWEYRVAIRDKFGDVGRTYGGLEIETPPASAATTVIRTRAVNTLNGRASIGDTAYLVAEFTSASRGLKMLRWFRNGAGTPVRTVLSLPMTGVDTMVFICPNQASSHSFRVEIADEGGNEWMASVAVSVELDPPSINLPPTATGRQGASLYLSAAVKDGLGRIARIEWDIGGTGQWATTLGNDTLVTLPSQGVLSYPCIARVTDDDGLAAVDTTLVYVTPWISLARLPGNLIGSGAVAAGGKVYALGGTTPAKALSAFDPQSGKWTSLAPMITPRANFAAVEWNGRINVFGGTDVNGKSLRKAEQYDPATDTWTTLPDIPGTRYDHAVAIVQGKIYLIGGISHGFDSNDDRMKTIDVFDPSLQSWSSFTTSPPFEQQVKATTVGDEVVVFSQYPARSGEYAIFNPLQNIWHSNGSLPHRFSKVYSPHYNLNGFSVQAVMGRVFVAGGAYSHQQIPGAKYPPITDVQVFNPASGTWQAEFPLLAPKEAAAMTAIGDALYMLGGVNQYLSGGFLKDMEYYPNLK